MVDLKAVITEVQAKLPAELGAHLRALYLFGSAARDQYVPGRSDIDLLLVVDPSMPLLAARDAFRAIWRRHGDALGHGPLIGTSQDLALHLALFPSLHRALQTDAILLDGEPVLERFPTPPPADPVQEAADVAVRTITRASALTPGVLPPQRTRHLARLLNRLARRVTGIAHAETLTPVQAVAALHVTLREMAKEMPQFDWQGARPSGELPDLLPGCLAFYQRERHLIAVLERVNEEILEAVDWDAVGEAAEDAGAWFGLATPWQLRLAASENWVDSLFFNGFDQMWGADILGDLKADESILLRQLARIASEQRVERIPVAYCTIDDAEVSELIHDTQNVLLNAGLRAELFARLTGRVFDLADWTPPGREVSQPERVAATWGRWREITAYYVQLWQQAAASPPSNV